MILDVLENHEGPLTASFQAVYGLRLLTAIQERSYDELLDLIVWLPEGSAFWAAKVADGDFDQARRLLGWTTEMEFKVYELNLLLEHNWMFASAHSRRPVKEPILVDSPLKSIDRPKRRRSLTDAEMMARQFLDMQ